MDAGALSWRALDFDPPTHGFDELVDQAHAQTGALLKTPRKGDKQAIQLFARHSATVVSYREADRGVRNETRQPYRRGGGILDGFAGIAEEVHQRSMKAGGI